MTSIDVPENVAGAPPDPMTAQPGDEILGDLPLGPGVLSADAGTLSAGAGSGWLWNMQSPVLAWLISVARPVTLVELGASRGDTASAICQAVQHFGLSARFVGVGEFSPSVPGTVGGPGPGEPSVIHDARRRFGSWVEFAELHGDPAPAPQVVDFLHLQFSDPALDGEIPLAQWLDRLAPGAFVVVSGTDRLRERPGVWDLVSERCRMVRLDGADIAVGQVPLADAAPLADLLSARPDVCAQLVLLAERGDYRYLLGSRPSSPGELRAGIRDLEEQRNVELEASRRGLDEIRGQFDQVIEERSDSIHEVTAAHDQEVRVLQEEIERLMAKVAITAARYERKLKDQEKALTEAEAERRSELESQYNALHQEIVSLKASTSWRLTSPLRLLSGRVRGHAG